jgi:hypothetical protein
VVTQLAGDRVISNLSAQSVNDHNVGGHSGKYFCVVCASAI